MNEKQGGRRAYVAQGKGPVAGERGVAGVVGRWTGRVYLTGHEGQRRFPSFRVRAGTHSEGISVNEQCFDSVSRDTKVHLGVLYLKG